MNNVTYTQEQIALAKRFAAAETGIQEDRRNMFDVLMSAVLLGMELSGAARQTAERPGA